jgi:prepilin peptidase CpaA
MLSTGYLMDVSLLLLCIAALYDIGFRKIPNGVCLLIAVLGLIFRVHDHRVVSSVAVAAVVFGLALLAWRRHWMGGGDVKLLTAAAILVPPTHVVHLVLFIALAGGILALLYLALSRILPPPAGVPPRSRLSRILRIEQRRVCRRASIPYGVAIWAGAFISLAGVHA